MTTDSEEWGQFIDWKNQLIHELEIIGDPGMIGLKRPFIDAMIPFRMGFSPSVTARALLGHNYKVMKSILDTQFFDNQEAILQLQLMRSIRQRVQMYWLTESDRWEDDGGAVI